MMVLHVERVPDDRKGLDITHRRAGLDAKDVADRFDERNHRGLEWDQISTNLRRKSLQSPTDWKGQDLCLETRHNF